MAPSAPRYHALDGLRAVMMLLGIYLHATVAYSHVGGWPFKQPELTGTLNITLGFIHLFRMPVFYVMAGFFGSLLYTRRGILSFADNRIKRVLLPFIVGWCILFPIVVMLSAFAKSGAGAAVGVIATGKFLDYAHPMHLWFLEYLVLLYAAAGALAFVIERVISGRVLAGCNRVFRAIAGSIFAPLVFAIPSFLALLPMAYAGLEDPPSFTPQPRIVFAYFVPFVFGWVLYRNVDLLDVMRRRAWAYTGVALIPLTFYLGVVHVTVPKVVSFYADRALHSIALWLLIYGVTGLFLRYLSEHSARMRYASDSAYFLYLAHMPVMMVFQILLLHVGWHPIVKIFVVLGLTVPILLVMYHYWVRPTFLGAALNGRRYPIRSEAQVAVAA